MYGDINKELKQPLNVDTNELLKDIDVDEILENLDKADSIENMMGAVRGFDPDVLNVVNYDENDPKAKGSVTLQKLREDLNEIDSKELTLVGVERKKQILKNIDLIEKIKITDPKVLLKIFNSLKYKQPVLSDFI